MDVVPGEAMSSRSRLHLMECEPGVHSLRGCRRQCWARWKRQVFSWGRVHVCSSSLLSGWVRSTSVTLPSFRSFSRNVVYVEKAM